MKRSTAWVLLVSVVMVTGSCTTYQAVGVGPAGLRAGEEADDGVRVIQGSHFTAFVPERDVPGDRDRADIPGTDAPDSQTWPAGAEGLPVAGFIFYPGAYVDPAAYTPWLRKLAASGRTVAVVDVPFGLALLGRDRAVPVMKAFPEIAGWVLGGHSLGGVGAAGLASRVVSDDSSGESDADGMRLAGIAFFASYPAGGVDLSAAPWPVLSLSASADLLATAEDIAEYRHLLPSTTRYRVIEGGNHAGFGSYGPQKGDGVSTLAPGVQEATIVEEMMTLLAAADAYLARGR